MAAAAAELIFSRPGEGRRGRACNAPSCQPRSSATHRVLRARIGLDYGELDVLRDDASGLVYVVDANRTPIRPRGLARADEDAAFGPLAEGLRELLR